MYKRKKNTRYSIIIDLEGCFPRTGQLEGSVDIQYEIGDELVLVFDHDFIGSKTKLGCNVDNLSRCVRIGDKIYLAEGKIIG